MQKTRHTRGLDCLGEDRVEPEGSHEVQSMEALEQKEENGADDLLEQLVNRDNLNEAYRRVKRNGGAAGIDGMTVEEMLPYLKGHREELIGKIRAGKYKPKPVRRVEIPKALVQVLTPRFEPTFSESSYGFRPGRSAHQAIRKTKEYYEEGYWYVVDLDMEKYFDTVNHDILMTAVQKQVESRTVRKLIRAFLNSGVMEHGVEFLEGKLKLKVSREKSQVGSPLKRKFLGFSLYATTKGKAKIRPHQKPKQQLKKKIRQITKRNRGRSIDRILLELNRYTRGWIQYYGIGEMKKFMMEMNQWIRRRLRMYIWKQWKKVSARFRNLKQLGIERRKAWEWANTRKGYWRTAQSWILTRTLTDKYLESLGYRNVAKQYEVLHLTF